MSNATSDLKILAVLTLGSALTIGSGAVSGTPFAFLAGVPLLLVAPGYAILAAFVPEAGPNSAGTDSPMPISGLEWWLLSLVLSLLVVPAVAITIVALPIVFGPATLAGALGSVTVGALALAAKRRRTLPADRRYRSNPTSWFAGWGRAFRTDSVSDAMLSVALVVAISLALASGFYAIGADQQDGAYTELYVLSENESGDSLASEFPDEIEAGESFDLTVAVGNEEGEPKEYTVIVQEQRLEDDRVIERTELDRIDYQLADEETGYDDRTIEPSADEGMVRITLLLFPTDDGEVPDSPSESNAYRYAYVWTDVQPTDGEG